MSIKNKNNQEFKSLKLNHNQMKMDKIKKITKY